jgi:hypothetical protein
MEHLGYPPLPQLDDGIEVSREAYRQAWKGGSSGGFKGRRSTFMSTVEECSIDRRDWRTLSVQEFNREYFDKGRPVVLFGEGLVKLKGGAGEY